MIPPVGAEVVLGVPDGELEGGAVIIACESTGQVPDGLGETAIVIVAPAGGQVLVHDGAAADAVPLATKADVQALRDYVNAQFSGAGHTHVAPSGGGTTTVTTPVGGTPGQPAGTTVIKGK
jgi:hypothetical protein